MTLTSHEIRQRFLDYFVEQKHHLVSSYPLVPPNDPSLLFTNAGMVQFKEVFSGKEQRPYSRATSSQKCIRAGGKHNDLENVGFTARHHTFFEMLGNFSFGDYFKKEAIHYAWEFLIERMGLDPSQMYATVFAGTDSIPPDDEAYALWHEEIGLPPERIGRLGVKDNFWSMGDTGPCGPCSELLYDQGPDFAPPGHTCSGLDCDCGRYLEVWNLVFMQFERDANKQLHPLPAPCIDTGLGLERLTALLQKKRSNYDTDIFLPLIEEVARGVQRTYGENPRDDISMRVIADHARSTAFLIADGVLPGNVDRGYVLRRIMRRAIRHGDRLGYDDLFFHHICLAVCQQMGHAYPEVEQNRKAIQEVVESEEERFRRTLARGLKLLSQQIETLHANKEQQLPGDVVFLLYDTYGFPPDLTRVICEEEELSVDEQGFHQKMEEQKERGRLSWNAGPSATPNELFPLLLEKFGPTAFVGYEKDQIEAQLLALLVEGQPIDEAHEGMYVDILVDKTPFYGEAGGQIGDHGTMESSQGVLIQVQDTQKPLPELVVHRCYLDSGTIHAGDHLLLHIQSSRRERIRQNHSATHLLHFALRQYLGDHVKQSGSLVAPDRLRFDYSHYKPLTPEDLQLIEDHVNELIRQNYATDVRLVSFEEAQHAGAMALFDEKYGEHVRMIRLGPSLELCGGTHVRQTGDIGHLRILSEQGIAAGIRRIEATSGPGADQLVHHWRHTLQHAADLLHCSLEELPQRIEKLQTQTKQMQRDIEQLRVQAAQAGKSGADPLEEVRHVEGIPFLALRVDTGDPRALRQLADQLRDRLQSGVVALGGNNRGKAALCTTITPDLTDRLHAGKLTSAMAQLLGGKGGGKPHMAQGGGPLLEQLDQALAQLESLLQQSLHNTQ